MTDNAQQGYDGWDAAALGSIVLGLLAVILVVFLPQRDIGYGVVATIATLALAIAAGARTRGRNTVWLARIGSIAGVIAAIVLILGQLTF